MTCGYDRLEYSLMNDIYDEQVYGYSTNGYSANESYSNNTDYSDYESYNDGYKSGYRAAMEAFGKKKGFFANIWDKVVKFFKRIAEGIARVFGKKKSVPQKIWDAVTSEKGKRIAIIAAGLGSMAAVITSVIISFNKFKGEITGGYKNDAVNGVKTIELFGRFVKGKNAELKTKLENFKKSIKDSYDGYKTKEVKGDYGKTETKERGSVEQLAVFIAGSSKAGWDKATASISKVVSDFKDLIDRVILHKKPSTTMEKNTDPYTNNGQRAMDTNGNQLLLTDNLMNSTNDIANDLSQMAEMVNDATATAGGENVKNDNDSN